jgi:hypothetical protein
MHMECDKYPVGIFDEIYKVLTTLLPNFVGVSSISHKAYEKTA